MTNSTQRTEIWDEDPVILALVLISITITLIGDLLTCFIPSLKKSLPSSGTNPSTKKKVSNSTKRSATSRTHPGSPSPALVTSTETSVASSGATGCPSTATKISKDGTTSQPTKKSRSGRLTASASPQVMTKSNQTTQIPGLGFSA